MIPTALIQMTFLMLRFVTCARCAVCAMRTSSAMQALLLAAYAFTLPFRTHDAPHSCCQRRYHAAEYDP